MAGRNCTRLDVRERTAQVLMTSIRGTEINEEIVRVLDEYAGSVILYRHNIVDRAQLKDLIEDMRAAAPLRLRVATDEEGGRVARLGPKGLVDEIRSARRLAESRTAKRVRFLGKRLGTQMKDVGVDWNLAPVLDVTDAPDESVIGNRSYSDDPEVVARYASAFARGLQAGGVLTTAKHFPGHGRASEDPHAGSATVTASMSALRRKDLKPYALALPHLDAVMKSHVTYTALDPDAPASMSRSSTRLLRKDIGFDGVVMVDSIWMRAIADRWTIEQAAERALRTGSDLILTGHPKLTIAAATHLRESIRSGDIRKKRLDRAVARVLHAKGYGDDRIGCMLRRRR